MEIVDDQDNGVTGTARLIGEQVRLQVVSVPRGYVLSDIQWTIAGETVQSYEQTRNRSTLTRLTPADLRRRFVTFYWTTTGAKQLRVEATIDAPSGPVRASASTAIACFGPTQIAATSVTDAVRVGNAYLLPGWWLSFGQAASVGIRWRFRVAAPAPPPHPALPQPYRADYGEGELAMTQLIDMYREQELAPPPAGRRQNASSRGFWMLDTRERYAGIETPIARGNPAVWTSSDSPGNELINSIVRSAASDRFRSYFLYRPSLPGAIWVTVCRMEWDWRGEARFQANDWTGPHNPGHTPDPTALPSSELPEWAANAADLGWTDIGPGSSSSSTSSSSSGSL